MFYTPQALADEVAELALQSLLSDLPASDLDELRAPKISVWDPACGSGALLCAVARSLLARGLSPATVLRSLHGSDIDETAVVLCRAAVLAACNVSADHPKYRELAAVVGRQIRVSDSLREAAPAGEGRKVCILNPPFGSAITRDTRRSDADRARWADRYPNAAVGAYDRACLFMELASAWAGAEGVVAAIVPRSLLAAAYAAKLRRWLRQRHDLRALVEPDRADLFEDAQIYACALILGPPGEAALRLRRGGAPAVHIDRPEANCAPWAALASEHMPVALAIPQDWPALGAFLDIRANATAGEAYELRPLVTDGGAGFRFVTTGLVEPMEFLWGQVEARYLKCRFQRPTLAPEALSEGRRAQAACPKVIVAGLSRVIEAVADTRGTYCGAVATLAVTPTEGLVGVSVARIALILNSSLVRTQYRALFGAQALGGGSVQVTGRSLAAMRVPPGVFAAADGIAAVAAPLGRDLRKRLADDDDWRTVLALAGDGTADPGQVAAGLESLAQSPPSAALDGRVDVLISALDSRWVYQARRALRS